MGTLMIKCPNTGCEISTGIHTDSLTFRHTPVFFARTLCPVCQTPHEWFAKSAWVREANAQREEILNLVPNRPPPVASSSLKSRVITAIATAAAIAAGFVAGTVAIDAFADGGRAAHRAALSAPINSTQVADSVANRAVKSDRLHVPTRAALSAPTQRPREGDGKLVAHCEPVGSPIAGAAVLRLPPRRCLA